MSKFIAEISDEDFFAEVLEAKLPVVVDFWASWCGPCRMLAPVMEELAAEFRGKVKFVKVNTDHNRNSVATYNIRSIPMLIAFSKGEIVFTHIGFASAEVLRPKFQSLVSK